MPFDNSSALWKLDRAKELLDELDAEVRAWHDTKPYSFFVYINPEYTRWSIIVNVNNEPPIIRWSLIIADIIHNLKCSLDHTFWALLSNRFPGGVPKAAQKLSFPIWDGPPNSHQRGSINAAGAILASVVDAVQTYRNPFDGLPVHPLAIIRDIDNSNKHKLLFTAMASIGKIDVKVTGLRKQYQDLSFNEIYKGEIKDGIDVAWGTFDVSHPNMKCECTQIMAVIAIRHPVADRLGRDRDDYAALIDILIDHVRSVISVLILGAV
jgi:hypothetical protein